MLEKVLYQKQIERFESKVYNVDHMVLKIQLFLKEMFNKKCPSPEGSYNAVKFNIKNRIRMEVCLYWVGFNDNNKVVLLKLRDIEIDGKYRNNGYCTSIVKFLENIAVMYQYDGIEIEYVCSKEMLNIVNKLNYCRLENYIYEKLNDYKGNYRKLF